MLRLLAGAPPKSRCSRLRRQPRLTAAASEGGAACEERHPPQRRNREQICARRGPGGAWPELTEYCGRVAACCTSTQTNESLIEWHAERYIKRPPTELVRQHRRKLFLHNWCSGGDTRAARAHAHAPAWHARTTSGRSIDRYARRSSPVVSSLNMTTAAEQCVAALAAQLAEAEAAGSPEALTTHLISCSRSARRA